MRKLITVFVSIFMIAGFATKVDAQVTLTGNTAGAELVTALYIWGIVFRCAKELLSILWQKMLLLV